MSYNGQVNAFDVYIKYIKYTYCQSNLIVPIDIPGDKWGFGLFNRLFCRMYRLYPTNLVCLANERFWYGYGWNPYL